MTFSWRGCIIVPPSCSYVHRQRRKEMPLWGEVKDLAILISLRSEIWHLVCYNSSCHNCLQSPRLFSSTVPFSSRINLDTWNWNCLQHTAKVCSQREWREKEKTAWGLNQFLHSPALLFSSVYFFSFPCLMSTVNYYNLSTLFPPYPPLILHE